MKKILIIEDNPDVRENLAEILTLSGYEAITAENGKIGAAKAQSDLPDLILCDIMMPERLWRIAYPEQAGSYSRHPFHFPDGQGREG
jgi:CheY-like chemotaxis protein